MKEEDAEHAVAVDAAEGGGLSLAEVDEPQDEGQEEQQHPGGADEAFLLADGAEDEVGVLFGHVFQLRLRAVEEALALQSAGADGYLTLVNIVTGALDVFLEAEEHVDAGALVRLEDVVERIVGHAVEGHGAHAEGCYPEQVAPASLHPHPKDEEREQGAQTILHPAEVERYDVDGEEQGCQRDAEAGGEGAQGHVPPAAERAHHERGEHLYEQQHGELAHRGGRAEEADGIEAYAYYEIDYHGHAGEEHRAGHAFAIEHEEEGEVDQGRPCLALHDDEEHGHHDEGQCEEKVAPAVDVVVGAPHELGQRQRRGKLGKLGRL